MEYERFLKLYLSVERPLKCYLLSAIGNWHEANDLLQEVSIVLWKRLGEYDESASFRAWAIGIARFKVLHWRRSKATSHVVFSEELLDVLATTSASESETVDHSETYLSDCLQKLSEKAREIVACRYWRNWSIQQVAEHFVQSIGTITMILMRSRKALRLCVEQEQRQEADGR